MANPNNLPLFSFSKIEIPGWLCFVIFLAFASVRAQAANPNHEPDDTLSDFTNNLFTDLGPLLALFGEQMTKQYISESITYYDYFIFGMGPIGVITTIVSTIRLCGPTSLRAFIGRSQEGNSAVEAELCTSTSRDVCELFNNGGITRVLGRPRILELIRTPKDYLPEPSWNKSINGKAGLYLFRDFVQEARESVKNTSEFGQDPTEGLEWHLGPSQQLGLATQNPPNLSLNVGITQHRPWVFFLVALIGFILQAGVLVVAGVGVWVLDWNLNENTKASTNYAPAMFIVGTITMCAGMCACVAIIGQATTEVRCKRETSHLDSPKTSLIWLQPRQVIADQSFDPYVFIDDGEKRLSAWTSSMKSWDFDPGMEMKFKSATCIAVSAVLVGYILQFIGLRGMRAWISIAQLITTVAMSTLRGMLRMQRLKKDDNELSKKAEIVPGYELDWLAFELSSSDNLTRQARLGRRDVTSKHSEESCVITDSATRYQPSYDDLMTLRVCLARITGHMSSHPTQKSKKQPTHQWGAEFVKVRQKAKEVAAALEQVAGVILKREKTSSQAQVCLELSGAQFCRLRGSGGTGAFKLYLVPDRQFSSKWKVDSVEIEAILGLAQWSLLSDRRVLDCQVGSQLESTLAAQVVTMRILSAGPVLRKVNAKLEIACWHGILEDASAWEDRRMSQEVALSVDTDLDSCSLGSLWQRDPHRTGSDRERNWMDMPEDDAPVGVETRSNCLTRICGWSCILDQHDIQPAQHSPSAKVLGHSQEHPKIRAQLAYTNSSLLDICAQELFGAFLAQLETKVDDYDNRASGQKRFSLKSLEDKIEILGAISKVFVDSGLGSDEDAIDCILPAIQTGRIGDHDRVIEMISSTSDSFLETSEQGKVVRVVTHAVEDLRLWETREEMRFFARALSVLSRVHRFTMRIANGSELFRSLLTDCWKRTTLRRKDAHIWQMYDFPVVKIEELRESHLNLWERRGGSEGETKVAYGTLMEALMKKDRSETLYLLCFLTKNGLESSSVHEQRAACAALPLAARYGWFEVVDALLQLGVDSLAEDETGRTALGYCVEYARTEHEVCAEIILSHDKALVASKYVSWSADGGQTPLVSAITRHNDEMVKILLEKGFPLVEQGSGRVSPLTEAFSMGFEGIARQLVDAGTELRREHLALAKLDNPLQSLVVACLRAQIEESRQHWFQQMLEIIADNDSDALQLLLDLGVEVEFCHIVLAIRIGHYEVKKLILDGFPGWVTANQHCAGYWLRELEVNNDHDIMQILLDHGGAAVWDGTKPKLPLESSKPI